jgi:hypothetical protein
MPAALLERLNAFLRDSDFAALYAAYWWQDDTHRNGFPDILRLEAQIGRNAKADGVKLDDVHAVAAWGNLRNPKGIVGSPVVLEREAMFGGQDAALPALHEDPALPLRCLESRIKGIGPTYLSKVLRFAMPHEYGAIDTRCIRVFGRGGPASKHHEWLALEVRNYGAGWHIPRTQPAWPDGYAQWVDILRHFAAALPANCPHPKGFLEQGLRKRGQWTCADVEMALFSYASRLV